MSRFALLLLALPPVLAGQSLQPAGNIGPSYLPFNFGAVLPATCSVGSLYALTSATPGQNLYVCTSTNVWTLEAGSGGGGSGSLVLTSGSGAPSANCAAPSSSNLARYIDTSNQDEWWCSATNTWKKVLTVTNSGPFGMSGSTGTPPTTPASGSVACYFDQTSNLQTCLDSGGNASAMVKGQLLTVVGKGTGGGSWTQIGSTSAGFATVTVAGALTTDTATCTETTPIQHGTAPHYINFLFCQVTAANTVTAYMQLHDVDDNIWFAPGAQTFNYIVYR
jgi:hypothetical protein